MCKLTFFPDLLKMKVDFCKKYEKFEIVRYISFSDEVEVIIDQKNGSHIDKNCMKCEFTSYYKYI